MMKSIPRLRSHFRSLSLESLETRALLTTVASDVFLAPARDAFTVPEDSPGQQLHVLRDVWLDFGGEANQAGFVELWQPQNGDVSIHDNGTTLTYTPDQRFRGIDSFSFTATDFEGVEYSQTVWLNVMETVYAVPDWVNVSVASAGSPLAVLDNDFKFREWNDLNELDIVDVGPAQNGTVRVTDDRQHLVYVPENGFEGFDSIKYTVVDGFGHQSSATVTVNVSPGESDADAFSSGN